MIKKIYLYFVFLLFSVNVFCQEECHGILFSERLSTEIIENLSDSVYLIFSEEFDTSQIFRSDGKTINKEATDLSVRKIDYKGDLLSKMVFRRNEYEIPQKLCITEDAIYLISTIEIPDGLSWNSFLYIRKLNHDGDAILVDTVLRLVNPFQIDCIKMQSGGIGILYKTYDRRSSFNQDSCKLYWLQIDSKVFQLQSQLIIHTRGFEANLLKSSYSDSLSLIMSTWMEKKNSQVPMYQKLIIDGKGKIVAQRDIPKNPILQTKNGNFVYIDNYYKQINRALEYKIHEPPYYTFTYRLHIYIADRDFNSQFEQVLVRDTSIQYSPPKIIETGINELLVASTFKTGSASTICLWKLDGKANIIWQKKISSSDYELFGIGNLFETVNGYIFFMDCKKARSIHNYYGWDMFIMQVDKNGNIINP